MSLYHFAGFICREENSAGDNVIINYKIILCQKYSCCLSVSFLSLFVYFVNFHTFRFRSSFHGIRDCIYKLVRQIGVY